MALNITGRNSISYFTLLIHDELRPSKVMSCIPIDEFMIVFSRNFNGNNFLYFSFITISFKNIIILYRLSTKGTIENSKRVNTQTLSGIELLLWPDQIGWRTDMDFNWIGLSTKAIPKTFTYILGVQTFEIHPNVLIFS